MERADVELLLWATAVLLAVDLGLTLAWKRRNRLTVGKVLHAVKGRRRARAPLLAGLVTAAVLVVLAKDAAPRAASLAVLALAAAVLALSPGFTDSIYGEQ